MEPLGPGQNKCSFPFRAPVAFPGACWWAAGAWHPLVLGGGHNGLIQADSLCAASGPGQAAHPRGSAEGAWNGLLANFNLPQLPSGSAHLFRALRRPPFYWLERLWKG